MKLHVFLASRLPQPTHTTTQLRLCDKGAGGGALVPPGGREDPDSLIVAAQAVDTGLDENEAAKIESANSARVTGCSGTYNLESLSLRLVDKCLRTATAFLINM